MAKSMARLNENNIVINIEWYSDEAIETDILKNIDEDLPVSINDTYENNKFYRNGQQVLTPLEAAYQTINELVAKEEELNNSYNEGVNSI